MDFVEIKERSVKKGLIEIYPDFNNINSKDLMVRGGKFKAVWNEEKGLWSTDEFDIQRMVDRQILDKKNEVQSRTDETVKALLLKNNSNGKWAEYINYIKRLPDNAKPLNGKIIFANSEIKKSDYATFKLPYSIGEGSLDSYEKIISTLYDPEERAKIEWAIGAIISGDAQKIQKFLVLYGDAGTGKGTILNIIEELFKLNDKEKYTAKFEGKELGLSTSAFATSAFANNPLIAIQSDGNLSKIQDNTTLNSIIAHEEILIKEKYIPAYPMRIKSFLFMGTNQPVKITDAKSGIIRRLIDVRPSGRLLSSEEYDIHTEQVKFELGAIANHCLEVYRSMGKNYYAHYKPIDMMFKTDPFYNFVEDSFYIFKRDDGVQLKNAWEMYKQYCDDALIGKRLQQYEFREELKNYFKSFDQVTRIEGKQVRSYYSGFLCEKFEQGEKNKAKKQESWLIFKDCEPGKSVFDKKYKDAKAQLATKTGKPKRKWENVTTTLKDICTSDLHYVWFSKKDSNLICIDFDIKDELGNKDYERNYEAALKWPRTYAELSKSGGGIHLYYIYDGDVTKLSAIYNENIEVKTFTGNSSLRRKLTKCNDIPIATISSGLPLREEKKVIDFQAMRSENVLRATIERCLKKEYENMPSTTQNVNFIRHLLDEQYDSGTITYDIRDMKKAIRLFCLNSTNQAEHCMKEFTQMHFTSKDIELKEADLEAAFEPVRPSDDAPIVIFDCEVTKTFFGIVIKELDKEPIKMYNPTPLEVAELLKFRLVGFNNLKYDNHILYARILGADNYSLYLRSKDLIDGKKDAEFKRAKDISYTDVLDFSSEKMSLKKFEIKYKLPHREFPMKWDEEVPEDRWDELMDYCANDVIATEALFKILQPDFVAREILADLSGLTVNDRTNAHTTKLIVGNDKNPQSKFVYTDLSTIFPGYEFDEKGIDRNRYPKDEKGRPVYKTGKSIYRGEDPSEGGYVYAEPGTYYNVALLDLASGHPTTIEKLNLFGDYTKNYVDLKNARIFIKHKDYESAKKLFDGKLTPYLNDPKQAKQLSQALKIAINSVYGLTSAKFDNKLRDPRNVDNIVAKHEALFMIDLKHAVQEQGYTVAHIKTDSIKIPNADEHIINFVMEFGKKYGYTFEHEDTYEKICLVNDAVYIAKYKEPHKDEETGKDIWWTATGAQFQHPYVFKYCFSKEPIVFDDMCETKSVTTALYLDMNEGLPEGEHNYQFIGRVGSFCPIKEGKGGGILLRESGDKYNAVGGTKGFRWLEAYTVHELHKEDDIDIRYFRKLVDDAIDNINKYGDYYEFVSESPFIDIASDELPF